MSECALLNPEPDQHGHVACGRCEHLSPVLTIGDFCTAPEGLLTRAAALVAYYNALPEGVSSEAYAEAMLLRRRADALAAPPSPEQERNSE